MSTLPGNHIATAAPFNLINPTGIDPGQSLAALIQTAEGARNRSTQERIANQSNQTQLQAQKFQGEQAGLDRIARLQAQQNAQTFQGQQAGLDRGLQREVAGMQYGYMQSDRDDREFFMQQERDLAGLAADMDAELDALHSEMAEAERSGQEDVIRAIAAKQEEASRRREEAERQLSKLNVLREVKNGLFSTARLDQDGNSIGHSILKSIGSMVDGQAAISNSLKTQISQFFENANRLDQPPTRELGQATVFGQKFEIPTLSTGKVPVPVPMDQMQDTPEKSAARWDELAGGIMVPLGSTENGVRSSLSSLFQHLEKAAKSTDGSQAQDALAAASAVYQSLVTPKEAGGLGVNQDALDMAMRMLKEGTKTSGRVADAAISAGEAAAVDESGRSLPTKMDGETKAGTLEKTMQRMMVLAERMTSKDGKYIYKGGRTDPARKAAELEQDVVDVIAVLSGSSNLRDLYDRLDTIESDVVNDGRLDSVLKSMDPKVKAEVKSILRRRLGELFSNEAYSSLDKNMPGGLLEPGAEDELSRIVKEADREERTAPNEEGLKGSQRMREIGKQKSERSTQIRDKYARRRDEVSRRPRPSSKPKEK